MWFPLLHQIQIRRNPNYFNSLFIGITAPLLNIWMLLFLTILMPLVRGLFISLKMLITVPILGLLGNVTGENITVHQAMMLAMARHAAKQANRE